MDLHLNGKVFLVTGAFAGIGAATARLLHAEGATVVGAAAARHPGDRRRRRSASAPTRPHLHLFPGVLSCVLAP
ncbi:hypothetical protein B4N89_26875 [Embleya scabrispora]|uniref:Uncharacterized protein n=1 Tax=Embleya scabrispora TaxID=159449 RepID=A0A1T3P5A7_9ACTN|nr:hypothetical protein B4N89_26875 [Embleya scabrispora]